MSLIFAPVDRKHHWIFNLRWLWSFLLNTFSHCFSPHFGDLSVEHMWYGKGKEGFHTCSTCGFLLGWAWTCDMLPALTVQLPSPSHTPRPNWWVRTTLGIKRVFTSLFIKNYIWYKAPWQAVISTEFIKLDIMSNVMELSLMSYRRFLVMAISSRITWLRIVQIF